jgi:GNAT superfamily N-acetyltransferase
MIELTNQKIEGVNMEEAIKTSTTDFTLRYAKEDDTSTILRFIKELAEYENLAHEVTATTQTLNDTLFNNKFAEVLIGEYQKKPVGFALFFHNYSTFLGKPGIHLEDLYVTPEHRGKGFGKAFLSKLAKIALDRDCGRLEWACLDWNKPSIDFYEKLAAKPMSDWTTFRLCGKTLRELANLNLRN